MRVLIASLAVVLFAFLASTAEAAAPPRYEMTVDLDVANGRLDAVQRTTYVNDTGGPLADLVFDVTPAYLGAFTLKAATIGGQAAQASRDGVILDVKLPAPLAGGASTTVELTYSV